MNHELVGAIFKDPVFNKEMKKIIKDLQLDQKSLQELDDLDDLVCTKEFRNAVSAKIHGQICRAKLYMNVSGKKQG